MTVVKKCTSAKRLPPSKTGMSELVGRARLPLAKAAALESEILALGAVHVQELAVED